MRPLLEVAWLLEKGSFAERGRRSGDAVATPVAQCAGHDYRRIEEAELPSESGV